MMSDADDRVLSTRDDEEDREVREVREWYRSWHQAWEHCVECGLVWGIGSITYAQTTASARFDRIPANQVHMRRYISQHVDLKLAPNVTEESLAKRKARQEKGGDDAA